MKGPVICAASVYQAREYATRRRIREWHWPRSAWDFALVPSRGIILLPGWATHHLAPHAAEAFARTRPPSGTEIAKAAVRR